MLKASPSGSTSFNRSDAGVIVSEVSSFSVRESSFSTTGASLTPITVMVVIAAAESNSPSLATTVAIRSPSIGLSDELTNATERTAAS